MKKLGIFCVVVLAVWSACNSSDKEQFIVDGKLINNGAIKKVLLYENDQVVDSAFLNEVNTFRFRKHASQPQFYSLEAGNKHYYLVLKDGERVQFEADIENANNEYTVTGSAVSEQLKGLSHINQYYTGQLDTLEQVFKQRTSSAGANQEKIANELRGTYDSLKYALGESVLSFAKKNENNLAGFYAMSSLDGDDFEAEKIAYSEKIKGKFDNNSSVKDFIEQMSELKPLTIGHAAPDFNLLNVNGQSVKLSDFKGKYVLLDFWASWCGPCREENPNVVKQYQRFKNKGFTVLGVSLDKNINDWKAAIAKDGLTWTQVSDLSAWDGQAAALYHVKAIPTSFLVNPEGTIVAKNLRGKALEQFLINTLD